MADPVKKNHAGSTVFSLSVAAVAAAGLYVRRRMKQAKRVREAYGVKTLNDFEYTAFF